MPESSSKNRGKYETPLAGSEKLQSFFKTDHRKIGIFMDPDILEKIRELTRSRSSQSCRMYESNDRSIDRSIDPHAQPYRTTKTLCFRKKLNLKNRFYL